MTRRTRKPKIGTRDTCARCELELEWNGKAWWDRGGETTCHVDLPHWPGENLKHVPMESTKDCGQCGGLHPIGYTAECRDDRYRF